MKINLYEVKGTLYLNKEKKIEIEKLLMAKNSMEAIKEIEENYKIWIAENSIYATAYRIQEYDTKYEINKSIPREVIWEWPAQ